MVFEKEKPTGDHIPSARNSYVGNPLIAAGAVKKHLPSITYIVSILHAGPIVMPHIASNLLSPITLSKI
jgi:hypothetical protein